MNDEFTARPVCNSFELKLNFFTLYHSLIHTLTQIKREHPNAHKHQRITSFLDHLKSPLLNTPCWNAITFCITQPSHRLPPSRPTHPILRLLRQPQPLILLLALLLLHRSGLLLLKVLLVVWQCL